jgi:hypothetical protein
MRYSTNNAPLIDYEDRRVQINFPMVSKILKYIYSFILSSSFFPLTNFGLYRNEDAEDRPWRPSHVVFRKSTIKQGQIDATRGRYFRDISIVRAGGENNVPLPEADEVVVYRSFMKTGLRFPLDKLLVEVLKTFEIYLHQLTSEAIIKVGIFIWAMRSQGLEPDARCFCNIHELSYETKATRKEQYHNNFGSLQFRASV